MSSSWRNRLSNIANIVNALLGVSIFSMPWGFQKSGILGGTLLVIFVGILSYETARVLLVAQLLLYRKTGQVKSYPEIAATALGPFWSDIVQAATVVSCLGGCTGYLIFLGETVSQLFSISVHRALLLMTIPLILFSWIRSFRELTFFTVLGVLALALSIVAVLVDGEEMGSLDLSHMSFVFNSNPESSSDQPSQNMNNSSHPSLLSASLPPPVPLFLPLDSTFIFLGPATFLFTIHYCVLAMGAEALNENYQLFGYPLSSSTSSSSSSSSLPSVSSLARSIAFSLLSRLSPSSNKKSTIEELPSTLPFPSPASPYSFLGSSSSKQQQQQHQPLSHPPPSHPPPSYSSQGHRGQEREMEESDEMNDEKKDNLEDGEGEGVYCVWDEEEVKGEILRELEEELGMGMGMGREVEGDQDADGPSEGIDRGVTQPSPSHFSSSSSYGFVPGTYSPSDKVFQSIESSLSLLQPSLLQPSQPTSNTTISDLRSSPSFPSPSLSFLSNPSLPPSNPSNVTPPSHSHSSSFQIPSPLDILSFQSHTPQPSSYPSISLPPPPPLPPSSHSLTGLPPLSHPPSHTPSLPPSHSSSTSRSPYRFDPIISSQSQHTQLQHHHQQYHQHQIEQETKHDQNREKEEATQRERELTKSTRDLNLALLLGYALSGVFIVLLGGGGFIVYRNALFVRNTQGEFDPSCSDHVCQNVLLNLSPGPMRSLVGLFLLLSIILSYILILAPAREHIERFVLRKFHLGPEEDCVSLDYQGRDREQILIQLELSETPSSSSSSSSYQHHHHSHSISHSSSSSSSSSPYRFSSFSSSSSEINKQHPPRPMGGVDPEKGGGGNMKREEELQTEGEGEGDGEGEGEGCSEDSLGEGSYRLERYLQSRESAKGLGVFSSLIRGPAPLLPAEPSLSSSSTRPASASTASSSSSSSYSWLPSFCRPHPSPTQSLSSSRSSSSTSSQCLPSSLSSSSSSSLSQSLSHTPRGHLRTLLRNATRALLVICTTAVALSSPYFGSMLGAVGGLTDAFQAFVLPPLIILAIHSTECSKLETIQRYKDKVKRKVKVIYLRERTRERKEGSIQISMSTPPHFRSSSSPYQFYSSFPSSSSSSSTSSSSLSATNNSFISQCFSFFSFSSPSHRGYHPISSSPSPSSPPFSSSVSPSTTSSLSRLSLLSQPRRILYRLILVWGIGTIIYTLYNTLDAVSDYFMGENS